MEVIIPVSIGELYDKLSILDIKKKKISNIEKLNHVNNEFNALKIILSTDIFNNQLYEELIKVNLELWEIEDKIRICEKNKQFDEIFINLARSVYFKNDLRAEIKLKINKLYDSKIVEVKSYENYK
jgi:hypothetical protein